MRGLFEKTPHDRIAGLAYEKRQVKRRPAPTVETSALGDVPFARIYQVGAIQTIANNTVVTVAFDTVSNPYTTHFTTDLAAEQIGVVNKGYYGIRFGLDWDLQAGHTAFCQINATNGAGMHVPQFSYYQGATAPPGAFTTPGSVQGATYMMRLAAGRLVQLQVGHNTGATRQLDAAFLEVFYLGTFTGAAPTGTSTWA